MWKKEFENNIINIIFLELYKYIYKYDLKSIIHLYIISKIIYIFK